MSLALGEGIAGWVAQNGEILVVGDTYADPRFSKKGDDASGHDGRPAHLDEPVGGAPCDGLEVLARC